MAERRIIALIGMKHCGKTSSGKILAQKLSLPFADTDAIIESISGKTARALFLEGGASLMAEEEQKACTKALNLAGKRGIVISTGGAFCENQKAAVILRKKCIFCFIDAEFSVLYERILKSAQKDGEMPAFLRKENPKESFRAVYESRTKKYRMMADITVQSTEESTPEKTAESIINQLAVILPQAGLGAAGTTKRE